MLRTIHVTLYPHTFRHMVKGHVTQPHQIFLRPVDLRQTSKKQTSKNRKRSLSVTRKASGILVLLLFTQFRRVFPWSCEPLCDEFPAAMSQVSLARTTTVVLNASYFLF